MDRGTPRGEGGRKQARDGELPTATGGVGRGAAQALSPRWCRHQDHTLPGVQGTFWKATRTLSRPLLHPEAPTPLPCPFPSAWSRGTSLPHRSCSPATGNPNAQSEAELRGNRCALPSVLQRFVIGFKKEEKGIFRASSSTREHNMINSPNPLNPKTQPWHPMQGSEDQTSREVTPQPPLGARSHRTPHLLPWPPSARLPALVPP